MEVVVLLIIALCYLAAWVMAMLIVTEAAKSKGYPNLTAQLWFIGLFGLIMTPCLIVAALPDKKLQNNVIAGGTPVPGSIDSELPSL